MPRKAKPPRPVGDLSDPEGIASRASEYLEWLLIKNFSPRTVHARRTYLRYFIAWCDQRGLCRPQDITRAVLERYAKYLYHYRNERTGKPLTARSQGDRLVAVRVFFKWMAKQYILLSNPASELALPKGGKSLPKHVLSVSEVEAVLSVPDINTELGIRDRAILELLYSTGIRRRELIELKVTDIDMGRRTLMVRQGKGNKDRLAPVGERALDWIEKYLADARPSLVAYPDEGILFLSSTGQGLSPNYLSAIAHKAIEAAEIGKTGSCHLFRHTMATLMLEGGADVRFIQEMLGHANLKSTQIYTQVSIAALQEVHAAVAEPDS